MIKVSPFIKEFAVRHLGELESIEKINKSGFTIIEDQSLDNTDIIFENSLKKNEKENYKEKCYKKKFNLNKKRVQLK